MEQRDAGDSVSPQEGIFAQMGRYQYHLEYRLDLDRSAREGREALRAALAQSCEDEASTPGPWVVVGFGPRAWGTLSEDALPGPWEDFHAIRNGDDILAPATQGDLWVWIHGDRHDWNFQRALHVHRSIAPVGRCTLDLMTFVNLESRDLTGFEDGTANPKGDDRRLAALVPDGGPGAGGSFAFTQRWVHDLEVFLALPVSEQERIIGRTKADSIELEGDAMAPDSHVGRTDVKIDGVAQKIWRRSTAYGGVVEHGLQFVAFACEQSRVQVQLERMFGVSGDGLHDRLTRYSRPVTGSYWFVPSREALGRALSHR